MSSCCERAGQPGEEAADSEVQGSNFVYQSGVMVTFQSYGYFAMRDVLRVGFLLSVLQSLILLLLVPFYWPLNGIR